MKKKISLSLFLIISLGTFAQIGKITWSIEAMNGLSIAQQRSAYFDDRITTAFCYGARTNVYFSPSKFFSIYGGAGIEKFQEAFMVTKSIDFNPNINVPRIKFQQNRQSLSAGFQLILQINPKLFIAQQNGIKYFRSTYSSTDFGFVRYKDNSGTQNLHYVIYPYHNRDIILFETGITLGFKVSPSTHLLAGFSTQYSLREMGHYHLNYFIENNNQNFNDLSLLSHGTAIYTNVGAIFKLL